MKYTVEDLQKMFERLNAKVFGGYLPSLPIQLSRAKTFLGKFCERRVVNSLGRVSKSVYEMRISVLYDLPEYVMEDVLLHEMIHYYISYKGLKDTSAHGEVFMSMMRITNQKYGRNIQVRTRVDAYEKNAAFRRHTCYAIAVVYMKDGATGVKVLPRIADRMLYYYREVSRSPQVSKVTLCLTDNDFFAQFPKSVALKVYPLDEAEIKKQLRDDYCLNVEGDEIHIAGNFVE